MVKLKIPSVQHLARHWRSSPKKIEDSLVKIAINPPFFNYNALNYVARDHLLYGIPEEQIVEGIKKKEERKKVQNTLLEIVPLVIEHFSTVNPDFVHDIAPSYYPIGRELKIPLKLSFIYGVGGQVYLPSFIFWKKNPMDEQQFSLFVSLAQEMLHQDPDLEAAKFKILDFSAKGRNQGRTLEVIDSKDVPILNSSTRAEMLSVFVEGFERAESRVKNVSAPKTKRETNVIVDNNQMPLWEE